MMPKVKIGRYNTTGGTEQAPPVGRFWAGWIEPEDRTWILFIDVEGKPVLFPSRDPETGAVIEHTEDLLASRQAAPGPSVELYESALQIGDPAWVAVQSTRLQGHVRAVTFSTGKVRYAVRVAVSDDPTETTTLWNLDSAIVTPREEGLRVTFDFDPLG